MNLMDGYTIVQTLGRGSYSTVYKAHKKDDKSKILAIKVVETANLSTSGKNGIITEISIMKKFKHPNIIKMEDFSWDDKNIYIGLEYCNGGDLSRFIKTRRKLPENTCREFLQQLAVGLRFLRSQNICHLDLKPQNLLLMKPSLTLKIGDFGFAEFLNDSTQRLSIRGSPSYMAPEVLLGLKYDARADLWSCGIITYECLFGKPPYNPCNLEAIIKNAKEKHPIKIPDSNVTLSKECQNFLLGLLQHDVEKRMTYEEFFSHPFLNLEYYPSEESFEKAVKIVSMAVKYDEDSKYNEAYDCYNKALLYLLPLAGAEIDENKKIRLFEKIKEYTSRSRQIANRISQSVPSPSYEHKTLLGTLLSEEKQLLSLCSSSSALKTAVEIGIAAEMYFTEKQYKFASEKFQACLSILVPTMSLEPLGIRRDILRKLVEKWLDKAEKAKELEVTIPSETEMKETCCLM